MASVEIKFDKGLNSKINFLTDSPGNCLTFSDYQLNYGILQPRTNMNKLNSSAIGSVSDTLDGVYFWSDISQSSLGALTGNYYINDSGAGKFFRSNASSGSSISSVTDITNSVTVNTPPVTFASLNGRLLFTGASGAVNQVTSKTSNVTAVAGVSANFQIIRTVGNFMFGTTGIGGASSTNSTIYWSAVQDPTTWPGASNLTFRNNDGDAIRAFGELNGQLLIFKALSIGLLQTTTQTVSGTVTLGPLTTLFQGIGCMGPNAVDNLPDGTCVFLGTDYNVYVTDGSNLISLTNQPPDGNNIYDELAPLINNSVSGAYFSLRYLPYRNEIFVTGIVGSGAFGYAYDIKQKYWRKITGFTPYSMAVVKAVNGVGGNPQDSYLVIGNNVGTVVNVLNVNNQVPSKEDGTTLVTPDVSASVIIPQNFFNGDLVCLTILYKASSTVSLRYGFDNTYGSSFTLPAANNRVDLKVQLKQLTNNQRPSSFQIDFQDNGNGFAGASIYKVLLSDEVTA